MDKVYNPETKRYVKRDSKKGIEILFKNKDKEILKSFELVNGKVVKRCLDGKIRNPKTFRCVKEPKQRLVKEPKQRLVKEPKSISLNKKIEAVNKIKKAFSPFVKRISGDIYTRVRYLMMMRRELKKVLKKNQGCLKIYKKNRNGTYKYRIGSHIILNKRIGTPSRYGEAYISEFRDKSKKLLTFVSKIYQYEEPETKKELEILELLTNKVRMGECPHFPITYGYVKCENLYGSDSFKKSNSKKSSIKQDFKNYPDIFKKINKKFLNIGTYSGNSSSQDDEYISDEAPQMITLFNELANGDLKNFIKIYQDYKNNTQIFLNSFIQVLLSIIYFYYHTDMIHNDCHWGNFLYHKIKKGGYFHYKIFDEDYYLENVGFLWVIWDYEFASQISSKISINDQDCYSDFLKIILCYLPNYKLLKTHTYIGRNDLIKKENRKNMEEFFMTIYPFISDYVYKQEREFTYKLLMKFITGVIKYFKDNHWLLTKLPSGEKAINKEPYVIGKDFITRY